MVQKGLGGSSGRSSSHGALYSSVIFAIATFMNANYLIGILLSAGQTDNIYISPRNIGTLYQANTNSVAKDRFATVLPENPRIHFIHIGKAGGQTIDDSLGFNRTKEEVHCKVALLEQQDFNNCSANKEGDSALFNHTIGTYHLWGGDYNNEEKEWMLDNSNVFLFTVRDPCRYRHIITTETII